MREISAQPLRIVLATRFYPPETGGGGIASYAFYLAHGLHAAGHHVLIISQSTTGKDYRGNLQGIEVIRLTPPLRHYRWTRLPVVGRQVRFLRDVLYARRIRSMLLNLQSEFKPHLVEYADIDAEGFTNPPVLPYAVKLHTPHIMLHPYYSERESPYARGWIEKIEKDTIQRAAGLSSPSLYLADEVARLMNVDRRRIEYVPNPIDEQLFSPSNSVESDANLVLYVGRLETRKGVHLFSRAVPQIARSCPSSRFLFLGADRVTPSGASQMAELKTYFAEEGLAQRVEFVGHAAPEVFLQYYRRAGVFVMPSLFENCPYTLLEAMACAKPCVVHRCSGMQEMIVDRGSGLFFDNADPVDLAEKVITLLNNPELGEKMGRAARLKVEKEYSLAVGTQKTLDFYRKVLKEAA